MANRASRAQGRAFFTAVRRIFAGRETQVGLNGNNGIRPAEILAPFCHVPVVFGACLERLGMPLETTARLFFFNHLRGTMAAAVRLNIVGPMEAQAIQFQLSSTAEDILKTCASLTLDGMAQTSPLLDLWQGAQDRLYSRLFQT